MPNSRKKAKGKRKTKSLAKQQGQTSISKQDLQLKNLHENMSGPISKLPMDLIIEILSRLPIETLKRVAMAVKPLLNLITHPRFVLIHHTRAIRSTTNPPALIVSEKRYGEPGHDQHFLIDQDTVDSLSGSDIGCFEARAPLKPKDSNKNSKCILGSCNGLLCMAPHTGFIPDPLYICNPVTGEEISLPGCRFTPLSGCLWTSGFGFDPRAQEYKVVRILRRMSDGKFIVQVVTVGSDEHWRVIPNFPYGFCGEDFSVFFGGVLHWIGYKSEDEKIILSFEVGSEKFGEMPLPSGVGLNTTIFHLGVFEGDRLFLATSDARQQSIEVLVQEKYGVHASWAKRYVIRRDIVNIHCGDGLKKIGNPNECGLMRLLKNGEILWVLNHGFGYYNLKEGTFRRVDTSFQGKCQKRWVDMFPVAHVESLISPKDIGRLKKRDQDVN